MLLYEYIIIIRPTLEIFWFAVYRLTHHFTPDPIIFVIFCFASINNLTPKLHKYLFLGWRKNFFSPTYQPSLKILGR